MEKKIDATPLKTCYELEQALSVSEPVVKHKESNIEGKISTTSLINLLKHADDENKREFLDDRGGNYAKKALDRDRKRKDRFKKE